MIILIIFILVAVIVTLIVYNMHIQNRIQSFQNLNERVNNLSVLQDFMKLAGEEDSVENKLKRMNDIVIEKYDIKYSTIVVFDGSEYVIKASNVDPKHHETLLNLHNEEIFQDSVNTATPKYVTIENENEKLPYQKAEMGRAKSAMFFPLYIDNIYIGYWIMESGQMHAFDKTDTTIIEIVKDNIISVLKTVAYQDTIENIDRIDKSTELHSAEYLYGKAKIIMDGYPTSAVCMFRIANIEEINEKYGRQIGNYVIQEIAKIVRQRMAKEYIFVRYMGPRFVIVFSGVEEGAVETFLKDMKDEMEELVILPEEAEEENSNKEAKSEKEQSEEGASPLVNMVVSTYYKGTGVEQLTKKLEEYIESAPKSECQINFI